MKTMYDNYVYVFMRLLSMLTGEQIFTERLILWNN